MRCKHPALWHTGHTKDLEPRALRRYLLRIVAKGLETVAVRTVVLGAGLIGVSTAYFLNRAGHEVTVIDRQPGPALETSFANGGQVSASLAMPWSNPSTPRKLLSWLGRKNAPLAFRLSAEPALWRFMIRFLANCRTAPSRHNAAAVLSLALYSRRMLNEVRQAVEMNFDAQDLGILHVYKNSRAFEDAARIAEFFRGLGIDLDDLNVNACISVEPALAQVKDRLVGGIFSPDDSSGNAQLFTHALAQWCADHGVKFDFDNSISRLSHSGGRITGVMTSRGVVTGERYVLALGSYSPLLLSPLGIRIPVYPAKGYSATAPVVDPAAAPKVSITDDDQKIVISRFGDRLRIAGMAEFNRYNTDIDPVRAHAVLDAGTSLFPGALDTANVEFWAGLRPLTPDGVPVIAQTPFSNLILNTGHGTLGWTLSCGSGRIAADLVSGDDPEIDVSNFGLERF